jgi:uncharacterized protein (TIGR02246 family)
MIRLHALLAAMAIGLALSSSTGPAANAASHGRSADEENIRALYERLLDGWNRGSGAAFASVFDANADLVGPGGFHIEGRDRIAAFHQVIFDGLYKDTRLVGAVRSVRFITDDVAVVHAVGGPSRTADPAATLRRTSVHSLVAVKRDGQWLFETLQNTPIGWGRVDSASSTATDPNDHTPQRDSRRISWDRARLTGTMAPFFIRTSKRASSSPSIRST